MGRTNDEKIKFCVMVYLLRTRISDKKKIFIALQKVYGLGKNQSKNICCKLGLSNNTFIFELSEKQKSNLVKLVQELGLVIKSDLKRSVSALRTKLVEIRAYRGIRAKRGFPVRGQRTHTNAKTAKKLNNRW